MSVRDLPVIRRARRVPHARAVAGTALLGMLAACPGLALARAVVAQAPDSASSGARARISVRARTEDRRPVEGAAVRSGLLRATTDGSGIARLLLSPGLRVVTVVRLGLEPDTLRVWLGAAADTSIDLVLRESSIELAPVIVA